MSRTVLISSLGLMGGSLAAALTSAGWKVLLHHRRPEVAQQAQDLGFGTAVTALADGLAQADLAVVCTPVEVLAEQIRSGTKLPGNAIFTDVGSVKGPLCRDLTDLARAGRFVGSHPMCGSHRTGLAAAQADLYRDALVLVTPTADTPAAAVNAVHALWTAVGSRVHRLDPELHDRAIVAASHLPHAAACAVAAGLDAEAAPLAAGGFRDTTRVAAGCPDLWAGILLANAENVRAGLKDLQARLTALDAALASGDHNTVRAWLEMGQAGRLRFEQR